MAISESPKHWPKGVWSATSQTANLQLYELREAADSGKSFVAAFHTTIDQNPFIPDEEKRSFYESLDEGERDVRYFGKYAIAIRHIYRMYDPMGVHGYDPMPIPRDWSRWLFLDPGATTVRRSSWQWTQRRSTLGCTTPSTSGSRGPGQWAGRLPTARTA